MEEKQKKKKLMLGSNLHLLRVQVSTLAAFSSSRPHVSIALVAF